MTFTKRSFFMTLIVFICFIFSRAAYAEARVYEVVEVSGYQRAPRGIYLWVSSGGCSSESQFAFEVQRNQRQVTQIKVLRIKNDFCLRYMPRGQPIFFRYSDMGVWANESFIIVNPPPDKSSENLFPAVH